MLIIGTNIAIILKIAKFGSANTQIVTGVEYSQNVTARGIPGGVGNIRVVCWGSHTSFC